MLKFCLLSLASAVPASAVTLTYFKVAARGELSRLYAHAGGFDFIDSTNTTGYKGTPLHFLPVLDDPKLPFRLQESLAVERYIRDESPLYKSLTNQQKALDDEFAEAKEDLIGGKYGLSACLVNASYAQICVAGLFDRYLGGLEKLIGTTEGFANGLAFPTGADLVCLLITKGGYPWAHAMDVGKYTGWEARFPKVARVAGLAAEFAPIKSYLATSETFYLISPGAEAAVY